MINLTLTDRWELSWQRIAVNNTFIWRKCAFNGKRWLGIHAVAFGLLLISILGSR